MYTLPELVAGQPEYGHISNLVVSDKQVLDLLGINVHSTGNDGEVLAIRQIQEPILIEVAYISGRGPTPFVIGRGGLFRLIMVGKPRRFTRKIDIADFAGWQFVALIVEYVHLAHEGRSH